MDRLELLRANLRRQLAWIAAADSKIAPLFAVDTAMLGFLAAATPAFDGWPALVSAVAALLLGVSLLNLFWAHAPRTTGPKRSLVYFGTVADLTEEEFTSSVLGVEKEAYLTDLAAQCHRNAVIAKEKYRHITIASSLFFLSIPFWIVALYVSFRPGS